MAKLKAVGKGVNKLASAVSDALDMSYAARMRRADEMFPQRAYSGSTHDIKEFDGSLANPEGDWGRGTYSSTSIDDVNANYAGVGPDLTGRIERESERVADWLADDDWARDEALQKIGWTQAQYEADEAGAAWEIARRSLVGDAGEGVVYPLRINTEKYAVIGGDNPTYLQGKDYYSEARDQLGSAADDDDVIELASELQANDEDGLYARVFNALQDTDLYDDDMARQAVMESLADDLADESVSVSDIDAAIRKNVIDVYDDMGEMLSPGEISRQVLQNLGFDGVIDNTVDLKFGSNRRGFAGARIPGMEGVTPDTQHIVTFPGKENTIRSTYAAFDPAKRNSRNILAGGTAAAVGIGVGTQSDATQAAMLPRTAKLMGDLASQADEALALRKQRDYLEAQAAQATDPVMANDLMAEAQQVDERLAGIGSAPWVAGATAVGIGATQSEEAEAVPIMKGSKKIIEAFHGSPHKFDKFSMQNIGTGEGAQAYGHGLYFADSEDVARGYRDSLSKISGTFFGGDAVPDAAVDGLRQRVKAADAAGDWVAAGAIDELMTGDFSVDVVRKKLSEDAAREGVDVDAALSRFDEAVDFANSASGSLYRVHLDVDPDTLLDWDKPLSEQSESVRAGVRRALIDGGFPLDEAGEPLYLQRNPDGQSIHATLSGIRGQENGREVMMRAGIPGIRYLDGNSRKAGEGSYNYVMFDDAPISIQERGMADPAALAATAVAGAVGAYAQRREQTRGQWQQMRDDLLQAAGQGANFLFEAAEIPWQGILGLTRTAGGLAAGEGLDAALQAGANQVRQPVDQTAYDLGGVATDATGSPLAGTAVNLGVNLGGPI